MSSIAFRLAELQGLDRAKHAVERLVQDSPVHAVLFYGARGAGKRTLANLLAQAWLCTDEENPGCGECRSCGAFGRGTNADLLLIAPLLQGNLISVRQMVRRDDEILPLELFARSAPLMGRHKVAIIQDAERMTGEASNAILKMLEEPPPYLRLIITSSEIRRIRPTILSRCLSLACELGPAPEGENPQIWALAGGAPGRVLSMKNQAEVYLAIDRFAASLGSRKKAEALVASDEFRGLADALEITGGARAANTEAVATLATALRLRYPERPEWAQLASEAHRRIVMNAGAGYVFDSFFAQILA